ncbi:MAG: lipid-A-disaccharide synthase [Rubrimonas sp.]|uniref:lipid-A-disaccharide synthase n=1 Tax=Rubrimonas sp. TaxID=2036015 RepID=UPI002FDCF18B
MTAPLLFLVAGEPSGDALGAALMRALVAETGGEVRFAGVGGPLMEAEGLRSLFAQDDLAVMGLVEVLPRLPRLLRRIAQTAAACVAARPDALITIDSPSFGLRVARKVRAADPGVRTIHYVAPSVWAWRPGRARKMAAHVDHLMALLPFEPPWFTPHGMSCDFVGHPVAALSRPAPEEISALRAELGVAPEAPLLLALPGSRVGEVRRHAAPFGAAVAALAARRPGLRVLLPTFGAAAQAARALTADWRPAPILFDAQEAGARKWAAFAAADAALAASGTVTLELAAMGAPMVSAYRINPLTALIVRHLIKVKTANLVNLLAGRDAIPEFLQERFRPEAVADALDALMDPGPARARQLAACVEAMAAVGAGGPDPALRAARSALGALRG